MFRNPNWSTNDYQAIAKSLIDRLELETDLAAMKFIKDPSQIPDGMLLCGQIFV